MTTLSERIQQVRSESREDLFNWVSARYPDACNDDLIRSSIEFTDGWEGKDERLPVRWCEGFDGEYGRMLWGEQKGMFTEWLGHRHYDYFAKLHIAFDNEEDFNAFYDYFYPDDCPEKVESSVNTKDIMAGLRARKEAPDTI